MEWTKKEKLEASVNYKVGLFEAHGDAWCLSADRLGQPFVWWVGGEHFLQGCRRKCYARRSNERGKQVYLSFTRPRVENEVRPKLILIPASVVKEVFEDE